MRRLKSIDWIISILIVCALFALGHVLVYGFPFKQDSPVALVAASGIYDFNGTRIAIPKPMEYIDADHSGPRFFRIKSGLALAFGDRIEIYSTATHKLKRTIPAGPNADFYSVRALLEENENLILISLVDRKPSSQVINPRGAVALYKDYMVLSVDDNGTPMASVKHKSSHGNIEIPEFVDNVIPVYSRNKAVLILRSDESDYLLTHKTGETHLELLSLQSAFYPTCLEDKILLQHSKPVFISTFIYTYETYDIWTEKREFVGKIDLPIGGIYSLIDKSELPESAFQPTPR